MNISLRSLAIVLFSTVVGFYGLALSKNTGVGISAGINRTSLDYKNTFDFWSPTKRTLFNFGATIDLPLYKSFNIQTGIRYYKTGNNVDVDIPEIIVFGFTKNFKITQNYLALPISIKFSMFKKPTFYVYPGLELGYLLSASAKTTRSDGSTQKENIRNTLNKVNLSAIIGAGIELGLSKFNIFMESFYVYGLTDVAKNDKWFFNWRTRELSFNVGLKFRLK